jgi:hypothetical protein
VQHSRRWLSCLGSLVSQELLAVCHGRVAIPVARATSPAGVIERCVDDIVPLLGHLRAGKECRPAGSC